MLKSRLFWRIYLSFAALVLIAVGVSTWLVSVSLRDSFYDRELENLELLTFSLYQNAQDVLLGREHDAKSSDVPEAPETYRAFGDAESAIAGPSPSGELEEAITLSSDSEASSSEQASSKAEKTGEEKAGEEQEEDIAASEAGDDNSAAIAKQVLPIDVSGVDTLFVKLATIHQWKVLIINEQGEVIERFPREADFIKGSSISKLSPEIVAAEYAQTGNSLRESADGIDRLFFARRINYESRIIGYIHVTTTMEMLDQRISSLVARMWLVALAICLAALIVCWLLGSHITRPISDLTEAAKLIAAGDLTQVVDAEQRDELGALGQAFNQMSQELSVRIRELQTQGHQLQSYSERLATVLGAMVEGVVAVDADEKILFANGSAFELLDFSSRRVIGRPFYEAFRSRPIRQLVDDCFQGQQRIHREIELVNKQKRVALVSSRLPGEPCPGVVLVMHDVTELRRLEQLRREFVSNVSHELKTPLTSIQLGAETLIEGAIDDRPHNRNFVNQILENAERLMSLIQDLLRLGKIESTSDVLNLDRVSVEQVLRESVQMHASLAESREIEIELKPPVEDELCAHVDRQGVRTIVDNLLKNAIMYTPSQGRVELSWQRSEQQQSGGSEVVLEFRDTGIGISPEHQTRIFERFFRVDPARSRDRGGTGLGLAIVKHLIQLFRGSIAVSSQPGMGTVFTVSLPESTDEIAASDGVAG